MNRFETSWKTKDGLDIFSEGWEPAGRKPKAVICLVHGVGEHVSRYTHVAEAFANAGYAMMGADLRGHGRSEGIRGHTPSADAYLDDIDLLLAHARARYTNLPLILYGHSLGGILVLYYGLRRRPAVHGVIATSPGLHTAVEEQTVKVIAAKVLGSIFPNATLPSGLNVDDISRDVAVVTAYKNDPLTHDRLSLGFGKIMLGVTRWTLDHAGEFSLPLLLMHGKADKIAYPSSSSEFAAALDTRCTLVLWDEAYHELHNEPQKEEVFKTMIIWMDARMKEQVTNAA